MRKYQTKAVYLDKHYEIYVSTGMPICEFGTVTITHIENFEYTTIVFHMHNMESIMIRSYEEE